MSDGNYSPTEKDFGNGEQLGGHMEPDAALQKIRTAGSVSISAELFERLYLSPKQGTPDSGIRKIVGIPTPIGLLGFLLSLTPLSNDLMGWRTVGATNGAASIGAYYFFGGLLMILGSVGEWIVGSTFPSVVFAAFGAFWLTWGTTLTSNYGIGAIYAATVPGTMASAGEATPDFLNAFGFVFIWMGVVCFIFMICSLRTNVAFFIIFLTLVLAFGLLTGTFWQLANGNAKVAMACQIAAGAFAFLTTVSGWYIFASILLASVDFPLVLPLGDLSTHFKGRTEKIKV